MKRFILILLLGVFMLAGCSEGAADTKEAPPQKKEEEKVEEAAYKIRMSNEMEMLNGGLEAYMEEIEKGDEEFLYKMEEHLMSSMLESVDYEPPKNLEKQHTKILLHLLRANKLLKDSIYEYELGDPEEGLKLAQESQIQFKEAYQIYKDQIKETE